MSNINLENWYEAGIGDYGKPLFRNINDKKLTFTLMDGFVNMLYETNMNYKEKDFFIKNLLKNKIAKRNIFLDPNEKDINNLDIMIQVEYDEIDEKAKMLKEIYSDILELR